MTELLLANFPSLLKLTFIPATNNVFWPSPVSQTDWLILEAAKTFVQHLNEVKTIECPLDFFLQFLIKKEKYMFKLLKLIVSSIFNVFFLKNTEKLMSLFGAFCPIVCD